MACARRKPGQVAAMSQPRPSPKLYVLERINASAFQPTFILHVTGARQKLGKHSTGFHAAEELYEHGQDNRFMGPEWQHVASSNVGSHEILFLLSAECVWEVFRHVEKKLLVLCLNSPRRMGEVLWWF